MELIDYVRVLRRRFVIIVLAAVISTAAAVGYSLHQTPLYVASTNVVISSGTSVSVNVNDAGLRDLANSQIAASLARLAGTSPALRATVDRAGLGTGSPGGSVAAVSSPASPFLQVVASSPDPATAVKLADAVPLVLPQVYADLYSARLGAFTIKVLDPAGGAVKTRPRPVRNGGLGLALGLVLGIGAALLRDSLDRSFGDPDKLENITRRTVLGVVPQELNGVTLPSISHPGSGRSEAYRQVRTNIQFAGPEHSLKTIVITSATAGEGKTTIAANLAVAFARTGQTAVIVDADLRRPKVAAAFKLPAGPGLTGVLAGTATLDDALTAVDDGRVSVLQAGSSPGNPSELLGSARMQEILDELARRFDVVIVDSPPVLPVADPLILAVKSTALVVVVRLGATSRERLRRTLASIDKVNVPLLGLVANGAEARGDAAYGYGYGYGYYVRKGGKLKDMPDDIALGALAAERPAPTAAPVTTGGDTARVSATGDGPRPAPAPEARPASPPGDQTSSEAEATPPQTAAVGDLSQKQT